MNSFSSSSFWKNVRLHCELRCAFEACVLKTKLQTDLLKPYETNRQFHQVHVQLYSLVILSRVHRIRADDFQCYRQQPNMLLAIMLIYSVIFSSNTTTNTHSNRIYMICACKSLNFKIQTNITLHQKQLSIDMHADDFSI